MEPVEDPVDDGGRDDDRPAAQRWRRLPPRIRPDEWTETAPATEPHEPPVVLGDGVAYRGGVPLSE